jgi:hypothetical protein
MPIWAVPSRSVKRETIRSRRNSATWSVVYLPCVPTRVFIKVGGVNNAEGELAETAEPHDAEIPIADGDRLPRSPLLVNERLPADEIDLRLERRAFPGDCQQAGEDRDVVGGQRVASRPKAVHGLAVLEEDRFLVLLDDQLGAELDVGRAFGRDSMDDRAVG